MSRFALLILLICFAALVCASPSNAQWIQTSGPYRGSVTCFAADGPIVLAGTTDGGIFVSTDSGTSWRQANTGITDPGLSDRIATFALTFVDHVAFAGNKYGQVFRSSDFGGHWSVVVPQAKYAQITSFAAFGSSIAAGTLGSGLILSSDGGDTWSSVTAPTIGTSVYDLATDGAVAYASTSNGVAKCTDGGVTWTQMNNGLTSTDVHSIAVAGTRLFAGTVSGVCVSTDGGTSWTAMNDGVSGGYVLRFARQGSETFACTPDSGVFVVQDGSASWTPMNDGLPQYGIPQIALVYRVQTLFPYGSGLLGGTQFWGVYETDCISKWTAIGLPVGNVNGVALGRDKLIATAGYTVCTSTDKGRTWKVENMGVAKTTVIWSLAAKDSIVFAGTDAGILLSGDEGATWGTPYKTNLASHARSALFYGDHWFAGVSGLLVTSDGGVNWSISGEGVVSGNVWAFASSGQQILCGSPESGIYLSTDTGATWVHSNAGLPSTYITTLAAMGSKFFGGALVPVVSDDGGANWTPCTGWTSSKQIFRLLSHGPLLFAGTLGNGVYVSADSGTSWQQFNDGLSDLNIREIAASDSDLYVGTELSGVWRRSLSDFVVSAVSEKSLVKEYALLQNYPNPFNPSTTIRYGLPNRSHVTLTLFNTLGQQVTQLINGEEEAGFHEVKFDGSGLASGVYFYRLQAENFVQTRKLLLIR